MLLVLDSSYLRSVDLSGMGSNLSAIISTFDTIMGYRSSDFWCVVLLCTCVCLVGFVQLMAGWEKKKRKFQTDASSLHGRSESV